jgi:hypothetical protein
MTLRKILAALVLSTALLAPSVPAGHAQATTLNTTGTAGQSYRTGTVLRYNYGIMEAVARKRMNPRHWAYVKGFRMRYDVAGYVAVRSCRKIGQLVYIKVGSGPTRPYQVVDCQAPRDRHNLRHVVAELDGKSAAREGYYRRGKTTAQCWGC